ncbi:Flp pilus assembly protein CpaB [Eubacteriaceae bacterium ES3]|nr:Flp pilus assembly protein CpaB [Eubacteriaceae bacterium ES3]
MKKLVLIALALSVVAGIAVFQFALSLTTRTDEETRPVVVAVTNIEAATVIKSEMVELQDLPISYAHPSSYNSLEEVVGRVAKENIAAGEQILTSRLSVGSEENDGLAYTVPSGFRAVTLETDEFTGVGGYLQSGDRVDVVATLVTGTSFISEYISENLEVLEVGAKLRNDSEEEYISVTVAVPKDQVPKLNYALTEGEYRIVLRSAVDQEADNLPSYVPTD